MLSPSHTVPLAVEGGAPRHCGDVRARRQRHTSARAAAACSLHTQAPGVVYSSFGMTAPLLTTRGPHKQLHAPGALSQPPLPATHSRSPHKSHSSSRTHRDSAGSLQHSPDPTCTRLARRELVDSVADVLCVPRQQQPPIQQQPHTGRRRRRGSRAWPYMRVRPTRSVGSMAGAANKMLQMQGRMLLECSNDDGLYALLRVLRCARTMLQKEEAHMPVWLPSMSRQGKRGKKGARWRATGQVQRPGACKQAGHRSSRRSLRPLSLSQRALQQRLLQLVRAGSIPRTLAARQAAAQRDGAATVMYKLHVRKLLAGSVVPSSSLKVVRDSSPPRLAARILRFFTPSLRQRALRGTVPRHSSSHDGQQEGILCLSSYGPIAAIESMKAICLARQCLRSRGRDICVVLDAVGVDIDNAWEGSTVINRFMIMECAYGDPTKQLHTKGSTYLRSMPTSIFSGAS